MINLHIDGNYLRQEMYEQVGSRVQKLYKNDAAKNKALEIWYYRYIQPKLGVYCDTGSYAWPPVSHAMPTHTYETTRKWKHKDGTEVEKKYSRDYLYPRSGYIDISSHHGIKRDAVEHRPEGDKHYFLPLFCKQFGLDYEEVSGQTIFESMDAADREAFIEDVVKAIKVVFKED